MSVSTLNDLYVEELKDLYSAETQLVKALPKIAKAATEPKLKEAVETHLEQTKEHVKRLEQIIGELGEKPTGHPCKGMQGLVEEGTEVMEEVEPGPVLDAALIAAAQKAEHYEIASYGTARTFAELLGQDEHAKILQQTLDEESDTDELLTEIAKSVNPQAEMEEDMVGSKKK